ncbi:prolyl oligopeptidase family serine peptidase [Massilia sp. H6]|uniref:alpha/beta hydrolase family protein n=1 Tax=Massilia sp. H6 TaxID=2970464 RepID=UPI0021683CC4|nr:prolyl oligopeptidase family serine peptidase [Massilia sp. H6]UVW27076.1 prolyl oligopeptidase family serine peptidase [Massilia sp. H6]
MPLSIRQQRAFAYFLAFPDFSREDRRIQFFLEGINMTWSRRILLTILVLVCALGIALVWTALRPARPVGFQLGQALHTDGQPFTVGIWYPTEARSWPVTWLDLRMMNVARDAPVAGRNLPLVVISHGNAGGPGSHADLALALAGAGHVVAAPMHPGDNHADQSAAGTLPWLSGRTEQVSLTIDYMLGQWVGQGHIDPERIGAFGFSAGGATVLAAVGARPDLRRIGPHCAATPEFICQLFKEGKSPLLDPALAGKGNNYLHDPRIKAEVVAAPGLGFLMGPGTLDDIRIPVQLWSGEEDRIVPYSTNMKPVRQALGARAEFHSVPGAGHVAFLAPCGILRPPLLCADPGDFDRAVFHARMNASVLAFFKNM